MVVHEKGKEKKKKFLKNDGFFLVCKKKGGAFFSFPNASPSRDPDPKAPFFSHKSQGHQ